MHKGKHLIIDCRGVSRHVCLDDKKMLSTVAMAAERSGANVLSQVRYKFGLDSPPGFTAMVLLDESHCSCHSYADTGLLALDIFTCGNTRPREVLKYIMEELDLGEVTIKEMSRFEVNGVSDFQNMNFLEKAGADSSVVHLKQKRCVS